MATNLPLAAVAIAAPALHSWWSGRRLLRSLDDPTLPEQLQTRVKHMTWVMLASIFASGMVMGSSFIVALPVMLLAMVAAQYPMRRVLYDERWSVAQFMRYSVFSFIGGAGFWLYPLLAPSVVVGLVREWLPLSEHRHLAFTAGLAVASSLLFLIWNRFFTPVWLALHQATPIADAPLLARFETVLDRAGRLTKRPTIHRYGAPGGHLPNAVAITSSNAPAVAMSDTLLANLDAHESTAIFAHEVAHHEQYALRLSRKRWALYALAALIVLVPVARVASRPPFGLWIDLVYFFGLLYLYLRALEKHRADENACDVRAAELTGDPNAVISALTKLHTLVRMPRRLALQAERNTTHPSLARRIQAIRAASAVAPTPLGASVVFASVSAGAFVALDDERVYWFDGVPADTAHDVAALRERASSYRAAAYDELAELRIYSASERSLRATDLAGRSWSITLRDADVAAVQSTLDLVDIRLGQPSAAPVASGVTSARVLAAVALLASSVVGMLGLIAVPALVSLVVPSTASLAAISAMALGWTLATVAQGVSELPASGSELFVAALGGSAAWLALVWHRARRDPMSRRTRLGARLVTGVLALAFVLAAVMLAPSHGESVREIPADPRTIWLVTALCGVGAALLTAQRSAWRVLGGGALTLAGTGIVVIMISDKLESSPSNIRWSDAELSLVASAPLGGSINQVELSPGATRFLAHQSLGYDRLRGPRGQFVTGTLPLSGGVRTVTGIDAELVSESQILVLAPLGTDSLELRLETHRADSAQSVLWRKAFEGLEEPRVRFHAHAGRWQVSGRRGATEPKHYVAITGALSGEEVQRTELPPDTLDANDLYSFADGARLLVAVATDDLVGTGSSFTRTAARSLKGDHGRSSLWRHDGGGSRMLADARGYLRCYDGGAANATCIEQRRSSSHVWSVNGASGLTDVASLPRRFERVTADVNGRVIGSKYGGADVAILDVANRRGVRTTLPPMARNTYAFELHATSDGVAALIKGTSGARVAVYRLAPASGSVAMQTAARP